MKKSMLIDLLTAYTDDKVAGKDGRPAFLHQCTDDELSLFQLTDDLAVLTRPVGPAPDFCRQLGDRLQAAATPPEMVIAQPTRHRKLWFGAILSGSLVSALGVLLVWWLRRGRGSPVAAG